MNKKHNHKLNGEVRFPEVRLMGANSRIMTSREAAELAKSLGEDLILINENTSPPLVKIEDYGKFLYNLDKAEKDKKCKSLDVKEIQLSAFISSNDLETKAKHATKFLSKGHKVKCTLSLKGREKGRPVSGELTMLKFIALLNEVGSPETLPKNESNKWLCIIKPKK